MRFLYSILLFISLLPAGSAQDFGHKNGYNLVWHDEFSDSVLSAQKWQRGFPWGQWAGGLQYYQTSGNHLYEDGILNLIIRKEYVNGEVAFWDEQGNYEPYYKDFDYSAGMLYSKRDFKYGYFEARFLSPAGKSFHNSFWMYGAENSEIDIFEIYGSRPERAQMTLHWKGNDVLTNSSQSFTYISATPSFADTMHTFAVDWNASRVRWYLDREEVVENTFTNFIRDRHVPQVPLNIILSAGISGHDGLPDASTPFPASLQFDFVRAYSDTTNVAPPVITSQEIPEYENYLPFSFQHNWLSVNDYFDTYPYGFRVEIFPGEHYTFSGSTVQVEEGYKQNVFLNVRVHDGKKYSPLFRFLLKPAVRVDLLENDFPTEYFEFFPNPALGETSFRSSEPGVLLLVSADGRISRQYIVARGVNTIPLDGLPRGLYISTLLPENGQSPKISKILLR